MKARKLSTCGIVSLLVPKVLLADVLNFEDSDVGSVPAGWTVAMTSDGGQPSWEIVVDQTSPAGGKVFAQLSDDRSAEAKTTESSTRCPPIAGALSKLFSTAHASSYL